MAVAESKREIPRGGAALAGSEGISAPRSRRRRTADVQQPAKFLGGSARSEAMLNARRGGTMTNDRRRSGEGRDHAGRFKKTGFGGDRRLERHRTCDRRRRLESGLACARQRAAG